MSSSKAEARSLEEELQELEEQTSAENKGEQDWSKNQHGSLPWFIHDATY